MRCILNVDVVTLKNMSACPTHRGRCVSLSCAESNEAVALTQACAFVENHDGLLNGTKWGGKASELIVTNGPRKITNKDTEELTHGPCRRHFSFGWGFEVLFRGGECYVLASTGPGQFGRSWPSRWGECDCSWDPTWPGEERWTNPNFSLDTCSGTWPMT